MKTESVLRKVGRIEGKPVRGFEAFETHRYFSGSTFAERWKLVWLDILENLSSNVAEGIEWWGGWLRVEDFLEEDGV